MSKLLKRAKAWRDQDPDVETRDELTGLIKRAKGGDAAAEAELADRFDGRLEFGTAGLRGELGAGSARMNRVLVSQAAAGLAAYLREKAAETARPEASADAAATAGEAAAETAPTVVIGYDGRRNSRVFAEDSAELFAGAGLRAVLLPRLLPTPVLAFAVRHLDAAAGVMVTASHNPPNDNGYKVYLGGADAGSQIVSPADTEIAAHILRVADGGPVGDLPRSSEYEVADESLVDAYVAATAAVGPAPASAEQLNWTYTAMHGVGWETTARVLDAAGYPAPATVAAQIEPDGAFPTVSFPNPEEPGAMDLAFATARASGAEFIVANDPDADRLAVAIPDADADAGYRRLTGNQVGLLLGWRAARLSVTHGLEASLACSIVSSPGLQVIAERYGLEFHATLTGFKWISRAPGLVFGFEEALGYLVNPDTVRDKDGISATVALLQIAAEARGRGMTLADVIGAFEQEFGFFASDQVAIRVEDLAVIGRIMTALRTQPPAALGEVAVASVDDLLGGEGEVPPADVLRMNLEDGSRVIVRPSGTEPKLKAYLDVRGESAQDAAARLTALRRAVEELLASVQ